jgi:hypothetical protein
MQITAFASGPATYTLGRIATYYRKKEDPDLSSKDPITDQEARRALVRCGFVWDREDVWVLEPASLEAESLSVQYQDRLARRGYEKLPEGEIATRWMNDREGLEAVGVRVRDVRRVLVNPNSSNGYPTMGRWGEEKYHPTIMSQVGWLKRQLGVFRVPLETSNIEQDVHYWMRERDWTVDEGKLDEWYEKMLKTRPELFLWQGKCKQDAYKAQKLMAQQMRFYTCCPRFIALVLQELTQSFEARCRNVVSDWRLHSAQGVSLAYGGAAVVVAALQAQMEATGFGYVHCGDDTWVALLIKGLTDTGADDRIVLFSLDASSFDLTQDSEIVDEIKLALYYELSRTDPVLARFWYNCMRRRPTVVAQSLVYMMEDCGPSGMPLQSKINDMIMEAYLHRLETAIHRRTQEQEFALGLALHGVESTMLRELPPLIESVGRGMRLSIRLEDMHVHRHSTIQKALEDRPFLFLGYYFHTREFEYGPEITVMIDVPRQMAAMPYPGGAYVEDRILFEIRETVRLASIILNWGIPTIELEEAFRAGAQAALAQLAKAERMIENWSPDERQHFWNAAADYFGVPTYGLDPIKDLIGLRRGLEQMTDLQNPGAYKLWRMTEEAEETVARFLPGGREKDEPARGAADEYRRAFWMRKRTEEGVMVRWSNAKMDSLASMTKVSRAASRPPTHPVTAANHGRPPPTARWGPDKPPRKKKAPQRTAPPMHTLSRREFEKTDPRYLGTKGLAMFRGSKMSAMEMFNHFEELDWRPNWHGRLESLNEDLYEGGFEYYDDDEDLAFEVMGEAYTDR